MWTAILALAAVQAGGNNACLGVNEDRIRMKDLAVADARFTGADPRQEAGLAPQPGTVRVFRAPELIRLAARAGIQSSEPYRELCFSWETQRLDAAQIFQAIRAWVPDNAQMEIVEQSQTPVPRGELTLPRPKTVASRNDGSILLRGYVTYGGPRRFATWARVRLKVQRSIAVALEEIPGGSTVRAGQVGVEEREGGMGTEAFAASPAEAIGRVTKRRILKGSPLLSTELDTPKEVTRGAMVRVDVREGATRLAFDGRAEGDGRAGDTVRVRNPSSGKFFLARVTGENAVLVSGDIHPGGKTQE